MSFQLRSPVFQALFTGTLLAAGSALIASTAEAASHREAPFITGAPKVDGTDFYMFRSYEPGRESYVTLIADYVPFQTSYGGPNFFQLDQNALYEIHIDNNGDAKEDLSFQFRFKNNTRDLAVPVGDKSIAVPLINIGAITGGAGDANVLNVEETYSVNVSRNGRRGGQKGELTNAVGGSKVFTKPTDNIGAKSIPNYSAYANQYIYSVNIPGCSAPGKVFVGQRKEPFFANLGEIFDLINLNPVGPRNSELNVLDDDNITSFAMEVPISCLTTGGDPVIGAWTTASLRQGRLLNSEGKRNGKHFASLEGGAWTQVSRLGNPLVNEVVIGLKDKDRFNSSKPKDDTQFLDYVTHPTLPVLINTIFPIPATTPPAVPRNDLVQVFLTGVPTLNQPTVCGAKCAPSEMLRLNTSIAATLRASQNDLGVLGNDLAGFPNGRRPIDDVIDIALRAALGILNPAGPNHPAAADLATDGTQLPGAAAGQGAVDFGASFPYLNVPLASSPAN
ncbi:MAG: DUF4331 domain-containing protein [Pseudomonadota bacterium]|nr:DUF4331 domain-containing protein [Pseudomonadota bacterium]